MSAADFPPSTGPRACAPVDGKCEACGRRPRPDSGVRWWRTGRWVARCCKVGPTLRELEAKARAGAEARPCPRKGERLAVLWQEPGSSTALAWTAAIVFRAMPSRGLFVAEGPGFRHMFDVENRDWRRS